MILTTLNNISTIKKKVDKAYELDEACKLSAFHPELLNIIFDKDVRFFVDTLKVSKGLSGMMPIMIKTDNELDSELLQLLKMLASEELRGNAGVQKCIDFADQLMPAEIEMFINILENKTRLGIGATDINKLCKHFKIEQFKVMFAQRIDKLKNVNFMAKYIIQPKIDGMRCIGIKAPNEGIKFFTRTGKPLTSLRFLEDEINKNMPRQHFVMDGEIESGACLEEVGAIRRKNQEAEDAIYTLFGIYNYDEWVSENHQETYESVFNSTKYILNNQHISDNIRIIPSYEFQANSEDEFYKVTNQFFEEFLKLGYEGAVVKTLNHIYSPSTGTKRSGDWIKIKPQETTEGIIVGILEGEGLHQGYVGKFLVKWLDKEFEVSPGKIKHDVRKDIMENPDWYIKNIIEFKYGQLNKYGKPRDAFAIKIRGKE